MDISSQSRAPLSPCLQDFLGQFLRGVDWMHMNNIVHRDLKPQNILVSKDGRRIKIADLGLSRLIVSNVVLSTQVYTLICTYIYIINSDLYVFIACLCHRVDGRGIEWLHDASAVFYACTHDQYFNVSTKTSPLVTSFLHLSAYFSAMILIITMSCLKKPTLQYQSYW